MTLRAIDANDMPRELPRDIREGHSDARASNHVICAQAPHWLRWPASSTAVHHKVKQKIALTCFFVSFVACIEVLLRVSRVGLLDKG